MCQTLSVGNEADIDLADCLEYLRDEEEVKAVGLYVETIRRPREFIAAARAAARVEAGGGHLRRRHRGRLALVPLPHRRHLRPRRALRRPLPPGRGHARRRHGPDARPAVDPLHAAAAGGQAHGGDHQLGRPRFLPRLPPGEGRPGGAPLLATGCARSSTPSPAP